MKAIVTGHSRGLGAAVAAALLERGMPMLGISRSSSEALRTRYGHLLTEVAIDLADDATLAHWLNEGELRRFLADAGTALLINNAGMVTPVAPPGAQGAAAVALAVRVNVAAPLILTDAFVAHTPGVQDRRIVHISSGAAHKAYAGWSVYCATKAALDHHARAVKEDAVPGLRICALAPGVVDTDMQATLRATDPDHFPALPRFEALKRDGELTDPAECAARLVPYILSDAFGEAPVADLRDIAP
ncbi:SDR family oxidoreductase [Nitrogeniibacter mangrovi]|uniref:SDR family oxidoreductase n=1 Tax=Nitrogeniibacter mangrovi TaxID=2016596 RepID=A0A6C1B7U1_9RHOO|nr:SDR family oxidoreductase [Nitrogeniibacter mangrovi]QID18314.1 SDR family oxidoreductase [Nitrogeniibacter mangrovi]